MPETATLAPHDHRSAEILASVRSAFAEKGFDGASMQDLARTAGMSVGNFYRYFPSKAAIVEALIQSDLAEVEADFAAVIRAPRPMQALRAVLHRRVPEHQCNADGQLWAEITAAALRKPEIGAICGVMDATVIGNLCAVFAAETGLPFAEAQRRFAAEAAFILLLVKSAACMPGPITPQAEQVNALILHTIDRTLDSISSHRPKA